MDVSLLRDDCLGVYRLLKVSLDAIGAFRGQLKVHAQARGALCELDFLPGPLLRLATFPSAIKLLSRLNVTAKRA